MLVNARLCVHNPDNSGVLTILFGTASGYLSAKLTDGNERQAATVGFFVSALNHAVYEIKPENKVNKNLEKMNLDPDGKPSKNLNEVANLIKNDPNLKDMYVKGGKPILKLSKNFNRIDKFGAVSSDVEFLTVNYIEFYVRAYESYYKLYQTI